MRTFLLFAFALSAVLPAQAQQFELGAAGTDIPEEVATWRASVKPLASEAGTVTFAPGDDAFVVLSARIVDGWRVYALGSPAGLPLTLDLAALPEGLAVRGAPGQTDTHDGYDEGLQAAYTYHEGRARVWQRLQIASDAPAGTRTLRGTLRYAACNDSVCLPPRTFEFEAPVRVGAGG